MAKKGDSETLPIIFRQNSYGIVKAITVYIGKKCGYRKMTDGLKIFTIQVISDLCEGSYRNRTNNWTPDYHSGMSNYFDELWEKVKEVENVRQQKGRG